MSILQIRIIGVDMPIIYIYISIYIYRERYSLWCTLEFMGTTEVQGIERWQKKKKCSLHSNKVVYFTMVKKKERERLYPNKWAL